MKVFVNAPSQLSQGIHRVARALRAYAPDWVTIVDNEEEAELRIGHVIGHVGMEEWCAKGPYALIQYCLRTAGGGPEFWTPIWSTAKCVWSYYDLAAFLETALNVNHPQEWATKFRYPNFYYAPLGVSAEFKPSAPPRKTSIIGTSGYVADSEAVTECYNASRTVSEQMLHLGPNLNLGPGVTYINSVSDRDLADFWSQCRFVAGLRRFEGFELPALEGLMSGARPVMFDAPHYRQWFGEFSEFIPEASPEEVTHSLVELFAKRPFRVVTEAERAYARDKFDWKTLAGNFWEALR